MKISIAFLLFSLLFVNSVSAETNSNPQVALDLSEGQRFTNSVAVGIIFSSMSKCVGENPDSEIAKVAGSLLISTAIAEFHKAKLDQIDPFKYEYDQTGLVNDAQKLSVTGEQIVNNKKYLNVLNDKRYSEESVKRSLEVAESVAYREMLAMNAFEKDCLAGIYDGAYKPIWSETKKNWRYGTCADYWGRANDVHTLICAEYTSAKAAYEGAGDDDSKETKKLKAKMEAARAKCQTYAEKTAEHSRMPEIASADACVTGCGVAASITLACKPVLKMVKEHGLPTINQLLNVAEPSSYNSAKILRAHHNTFGNMYQVCKRDEVLKELKNIKSVSTQYDPAFEKIQGDSAEIYQKYGGLATVDLNKYRTDVNRSVDDVHKIDLGQKPEEETISQFQISKEDLFKDIAINTTIVGPGKSICGDWAARACGEYSKLLMKSLNSCSQTLNSTVYQPIYQETINHYLSTTLKDHKFYQDILTTFKYFTLHGMDLIIPSTHAKSMTATVGGAIGLGGDWLNILHMNQRNLINTFDPLLSTYNKRIIAYQIARDLIDLSLTNTKRSIKKVETRLVELHQIKSTLDKTPPLASVPIISANITEDVDHKWDPEIKSFLDLICDKADCSNVSKNISSSISTIPNKSGELSMADTNVLKATGVLANAGDNLFKDRKLSSSVEKNLAQLENMNDSITKGRNTLQASSFSQAQIQNNPQLIEIKNALLNALIQDPSQTKFANEKTIPLNKALKTDDSVFYQEIKEQKKTMAKALNTATPSVSVPEIEYEELSEQNLSKLHNDIVINEDVTLWDIISTRYTKVKERLEL